MKYQIIKIVKNLMLEKHLSNLLKITMFDIVKQTIYLDKVVYHDKGKE